MMISILRLFTREALQRAENHEHAYTLYPGQIIFIFSPIQHFL